MRRRPDGALEADVLRALWDLDQPAAPSDVIEHMETGLAYTSIATILTRLCDKGVVARKKIGRAYVYRAVSSEADLTASRIRTLLDEVTDRESALAGFARALDKEDAARLASLLEDLS